MKKILRNWLPPIILTLTKKLKASGWKGDYTSWDDALKNCSGYDATNILQKVFTSTLKVKNGQAVYERDSVIFQSIHYSWPLLSALMWVTAINRGKLKVVDSGGSLGSSYFQNRKFLQSFDEVKWCVVEQKKFVESGRETFQDKRLKFYYTIDECIESGGMPDILLISGTLQYLPDPHSFLNEVMKYKIPYIFLDNTPFNVKNVNRLTIQRVDPKIYEASYPCWLLDYGKALDTVSTNYTLVSEHENDLFIYVDGQKIQYRGFLAKSNF